MKLKRIVDLTKDQQTDKVKTELFNLVQQFVWKYHTRYYPHFKGELDDLIYDIYIQLMTPKSREDGKEESLLDKFNPETTSLPNVVKTSVIRMMIDRERSDKQEMNYSEKYNEETGDLSLDWLVNKTAESDVQLEELEFTPDEVAEVKAKYDKMTPDAKEQFLQYYEEVKDVLPDNFKALFNEVVGEDKASGKRVRKMGARVNKVKDFPEYEEFQSAFSYLVQNSNFRGQPALRVTVDEPEAIPNVKTWFEDHGYTFVGDYQKKNLYFQKK